jgi:excisionase family DNA binding protein
LLGLAVRSVQLMVDRGELQAWKTPGGHRRISRESIQRVLETREAKTPAGAAPSMAKAPLQAEGARQPRGAVAGSGSVLVIEDSKHYQNLVSMLLRDQFPRLDVHIADDGIAGLAMAGQLQPQLLIVDILLPGIDGPTLIMSLRSHPQFAAIRLIVITSLSDAELAPYRFALEGVPVVHKTRLIVELPARLREVLGEPAARRSAA